MLRRADAVLVSDYGLGVAADPSLRRAVSRAPLLVWDPHPRGPDPVPRAALVTPNRAEAAHALGRALAGLDDAARAAADLRARWHATAVAVTMGDRGAALSRADVPPLLVTARPVAGADPCGAGDRLAAAAAGLLAAGADIDDAVRCAVERASEWVARRSGSGSGSAVGDAASLVARVRASGGTVVATGGCFDLLHAGHVEMLKAARRLGDCLVVCLNSDESVRRLKGPDRPLSPQEDRAAVLLALSSVDAVEVFDEDTPVRALERLRPDVFVKGADYARDDLPEAAVVEHLGGRIALVPFVAGRSTSELISRVRINAVA